MKLENDRLRASFSPESGQLTELFDKALQRDYLQKSLSSAPFRVMTESAILEREAVFSHQQPQPDSLRFRWVFEGGELRADIALLPDGLSFRAELLPDSRSGLRIFEYPLLNNLQDFGQKGWLAHSYATGILVRDPLRHLPLMEGPERYIPYPESFSGAAMQLFAYYEQERGGLCFMAKDGDAHQKWLNFYREGEGLTASHMYGYEDIRPGAPIAMPYAFELRLLRGEGWEEAAELYRPFALAQRWSRRGPARERAADQKPLWLMEKTGAATFGINAGQDRTRWLRRYREDIGARIFHVLGPDWTREAQNFYNSLPGTLPDWTPDKFSPENLEELRRSGDPFAAFEFDFFVGMDKPGAQALAPHLQQFPDPSFSHDGYRFTMLCPCDPFTRDFHRERDLMMLRRADMDAMYYDISANNLIKICLSEDHGHKPGGGSALTRGYQDIFRDTKTALDREKGRYVALGTEMINETLLAELDFYQARAFAQPSSTLETWPLRQQMREGSAHMIPLFQYVYGELGLVRLDGWGKLVEETGSYFYCIVSRVYLWGGLYELNHEYSPMELLEGAENSPDEHYFHFDPQGYAYSPARAHYLRQFAAARTGAAIPYWSYGRMIPPPKSEAAEAEYTWYHYNHGQQDPSYKAGGTYRAEAVIVSAYQGENGRAALFFSNAAQSEQPLRLQLSNKALRLDGKARGMTLRSGFDAPQETQCDLGMLPMDGEITLSLNLAPLRLYMLEIYETCSSEHKKEETP